MGANNNRLIIIIEILTEDADGSPISISRIANDVKQCYDSGATAVCIRLKSQTRSDGCDFVRYIEITEKIKAVCPKIIILASTGCRDNGTYEKRVCGLRTNPDGAMIAIGSFSLNGSEYRNSPRHVSKLLNEIWERRIKSVFEIYDMNMMLNAIELNKKNTIQGNMWFNIAVSHKFNYLQLYNYLIGLLNVMPSDGVWSISSIGGYCCESSFAGIALGGHVYIEAECGKHAQKRGTNLDFVKKTVRIATEYGRNIANPCETRRILKV